MVAAAAVPAVAAPTDPVPTGPCTQLRPEVSVTNVDTRVTVACTTVVVPVVLPQNVTLVSAPAVPPVCPPHPIAWVSNGNLYVQVGCLAPTVIPIPAIKPPPTAAAACLPAAWISGGDLYVEVQCGKTIVIPIPITGPPPGV